VGAISRQASLVPCRLSLSLVFLLLALWAQPSAAKDREQLRVVNWNVWGLPWGISEAREARLERVAPAVLALKPDVVCLQEVWVEGDGLALIEAFKAAGLEHHAFESSGLLGSGLLIASRYPIKATRFEAFELTGKLHKVWHGDAWTRKGALEVRLETPLGGLRVVNTHLHASYKGDEYAPVQTAQAAQLAHFLGDFGINPPQRGGDSARIPLLLLGDLNFRRGEGPFELLTGIAALDAPPDELIEIEWLLTRNGGDVQVKVRKLAHALTEDIDLGEEGLAPLSDHPALVCDLRLRRGSPKGFSPARDRLAYVAAAARVRPVLTQARDASQAAASRWRNRALVLMVLGGLFMFLTQSKRGPKGKGRCCVSCLSFLFLHVAIWAMYLGVVDAGNRAAGLQGALNRLPEPPAAPR
jgi:endonuclease/exonuclease/phosphatase family metal-dependent hydrolase